MGRGAALGMSPNERMLSRRGWIRIAEGGRVRWGRAFQGQAVDPERGAFVCCWAVLRENQVLTLGLPALMREAEREEHQARQKLAPQVLGGVCE